MNEVLKRTDDLRPEWDPDDVHDVRVALRRCRTMADTLADVNPRPGWHRLKKHSKKLFRALGDLHDIQVEQDWVRKLGSVKDSGGDLRKHMLRVLARREKASRRAAEDALDAFDSKAWRKLTRKLQVEAGFFPLESVVFQREALAKLNQAAALYRKTRKNASSLAWHRTRIGIKRFRYVVENFLPQRYEPWSADLKRMQDLLGDVHDLDVLSADIKKEGRKLAPVEVAAWMEKIAPERKIRLDEFRAMTSAKESPWLVWRAGFQWGHSLVPVAESPRTESLYAS